MGTAAEKREREAGDGPEQRILIAAASAGERPAVGGVTEVGGKQEMHAEEGRHPARRDAEDERQPAERLVQHDEPGEPAG